MAIRVISNIEPYGNNDWYIVDDTLVKGGYQSVPNAAARDSINPVNLKPGMLVYTQDDKQIWQLADDLTSWRPFRLDSTHVFRVSLYVYQSPLEGQVDYVFADKIYFGGNFEGSTFAARTPPTEEKIIEIQKNYEEFVGQITVQPDGTYAFYGYSFSYDPGDVLTLRFPEDSGMEGVSVTLKGSYDDVYDHEDIWLPPDNG